MVELERALARVAYLLTRVRRHDQAMVKCGFTMDRASVPLLRLLTDADEPMRLGELATRLDVEAPHISRQIQRLEKAGYIERVPDPDDRRAQLARPTASGRRAVEAIREVMRGWMAEALADWNTEDLKTLAVLNHRMVDDFLDHAEVIGDFGATARERPNRSA
ncbi:MarR family transcriptional regulator [Nocardia seriolae]|nr:MarR family transcriptional regulator [Nocardia seriolae]MTJ69971.1 MarR family transcriptional regulator [Nocardia seriolae]MTJ90661.1 MarR family transcriptional regulator [Nocardia seriolae]MTK34620.1 MarR family transcriptional regulator [Nocardia seriolae]MTK39191.1 MarR family transcriptional regulator [Nocardia seriolae]